jgi:DNA mismatch repair protein MutL
VLSNEEMNSLVDGLLTSTSPNYTPDGKTALVVIQEDELEKMFK